MSERRFAGIFLLLLLHAVACFFCVQSLSFDGLFLVSSRICCLCFWGHNRRAVSKCVSGSFARSGLRIRRCLCSCSSHCYGAAGSIPGWGTSTFHGCRKKQTNKQTSQGRRSSFSSVLFLHFYGVSPVFKFLNLFFFFFFGQAEGLQKLWGQGASPSPAAPPGRSPWLSPEPILSGFCVWGASGAHAILCVDVSCPHHHLFMEGLSCPSRVFLAPCQGLAHGFSKTILLPHPSGKSQVSDVLWSVDGDLSCGVGSVLFP